MKLSIPDRALSVLWSLMWFALPLTMRGTVVFLWLFGFAVLIRVIRHGIQSISHIQLISSGLFMLFLLTQGLSLFFDSDTTLWWKSLEKKSVFLIIPALLLVIDQKKFKLEKWAITGFISGLTLSGIIMIVTAIQRSINGNGFAPWSYHEFASPLQLGAIYLSWYYAVALIYLTSRKTDVINPIFKIILILFFLILLLLLASKLFIILTIPFVFYVLLSKTKVVRHKLAFLIIFLSLLSAAAIPFSYRMSELSNTDFKVLKQESFAYDTPFNGLTFRLIQWRFAAEILNRESAWITGVGINSSRQKLDDHYVSKGIYTGNPDLGDQGYIGYNYHNQYLETLVSSGVFGLFFLLLIILNIFFSRKDKLLFPLYVYIVTILFFVTESVLERQAGIIFFCLIVLTLNGKHSTAHGSHTDETQRT